MVPEEPAWCWVRPPQLHHPQSQRGKGKPLTGLNANHSVSISHTLKLAELARLVAGYTQSECPHGKNRWRGCPGLSGSAALPAPWESHPTASLTPRATRAVPSKATAGWQPPVALRSPTKQTGKLRHGKPHTRGAQFHTGGPGVGVLSTKTWLPVGSSVGRSVQLGAGHAGAFPPEPAGASRGQRH